MGGLCRLWCVNTRGCLGACACGYVHNQSRVTSADVTQQCYVADPEEGCNDYGKYRSKLTWLVGDTPRDIESFYKRADIQEFNLPEGCLNVVVGDYWKSKKGSNCFRPKANGSHVLIRDGWGGCFNSYRGWNLQKLKHVYYCRASSNGGGSGNDYAIVVKGTKFQMSTDDI